MMKPGVQMPHCKPASSRKACCSGCRSLGFREAFDRFQPATFDLDRQHEAAIHRPAIEKHRAGSAIAVRAAFLGAGQLQHVAQDFEQRLSRRAEEFFCAAVNRRRNHPFTRHSTQLPSFSWMARERRRRAARSGDGFAKDAADEHLGDMQAELDRAAHVVDRPGHGSSRAGRFGDRILIGRPAGKRGARLNGEERLRRDRAERDAGGDDLLSRLVETSRQPRHRRRQCPFHFAE